MPRIELRNTGVPLSEPLREHVVRKLGFALRRFAFRVDRVVVRLVDLNGPKGGRDKRCRILAFLSSPSRIVVEATDADAYAAVSQAALRLDEQIARLVRMRRGRPLAPRRRPPRPRPGVAPPAPAGEQE